MLFGCVASMLHLMCWCLCVVAVVMVLVDCVLFVSWCVWRGVFCLSV